MQRAARRCGGGAGRNLSARCGLGAAARWFHHVTPASQSSRVSGRTCAVPELPRIELPPSLAGARRRIAVAMSGGVDSSVTAWLLKQAGHDVFGIHMRNWEEEEERGMHREVSGQCSSMQDLLDAARTCRALDIPLKEVRFVREYWTDVFEPMVDMYMAGVTPNPDVACNREIKFKSLLEQAHVLGAELLATGHYAKLRYTPCGTHLLQARDASKDQSYFLSSVPGRAFDTVVFPLGGLLKEEVRRLAAHAVLPTAHKRESMGLCFVGRRRFDQFLNDYVPGSPPPSSRASDSTAPGAHSAELGGRFVCGETGRDLGPHRGQHLYTIGQGAKIAGAAAKWYVAEKRGPHLVLVPHTDHAALYTLSLIAGPIHWIAGHAPDAAHSASCTAERGRYKPLSSPRRAAAAAMPEHHHETAAAERFYLSGEASGRPGGIECCGRLRHLQALQPCRLTVLALSPPSLPPWLRRAQDSFHISAWGLSLSLSLSLSLFFSLSRALSPFSLSPLSQLGWCGLWQGSSGCGSSWGRASSWWRSCLHRRSAQLRPVRLVSYAHIA